MKGGLMKPVSDYGRNDCSTTG